MTSTEIHDQIAKLSPWFYPFDLGDGIRTATGTPDEVVPIFETRLRMLLPTVQAHFGGRLGEVDCLDVGCHEGYYSVALARAGVRKVVGVDPREENLQRARFVAGALKLPNIEYRQGRFEDLRVEKPYPLTLCFGLLYHVENPMLCLRTMAEVTGELCMVETQVIDEIEGVSEWGAKAWTRPYQGVIAIIDEGGEFHVGNRETGVTVMATCPSLKALLYMLRNAGFRRVEVIEPPPGAY